MIWVCTFKSESLCFCRVLCEHCMLIYIEAQAVAVTAKHRAPSSYHCSLCAGSESQYEPFAAEGRLKA